MLAHSLIALALGGVGYGLHVLAEASFDFSPLLNVGGIGVVLAWVLWKLEPRMRAIEVAIERQTRAHLIFLLEIKKTSTEAKEAASGIIKEIDDAAKVRGE